jgi:hypothetical protein
MRKTKNPKEIVEKAANGYAKKKLDKKRRGLQGLGTGTGIGIGKGATQQGVVGDAG